MPTLRLFSIIAATLLLVAGAVGTGYYAGQQGNSTTAATHAGDLDLDTPLPFQDAGARLELSNADGMGCRMDFKANSAVCKMGDTTQYMSVDMETHDLVFRTTHRNVDGEEECSESKLSTPGGSSSNGGSDADSLDDLVILKSSTKRVNSWEINVPTELGGDTLDQFEYFEKDGQPWKIEAFEKGADAPAVMHLSQPEGSTENSNPEWIQDRSDNGVCPDKGRALLFDLASGGVDSGSGSLRGRKNFICGGFCMLAIGIGAITIAATVFWGAVIGLGQLFKHVCRRRRMLAAGSMKNALLGSRTGGHAETVSRMLQSAATAAVVAGVSNAIGGGGAGNTAGVKLLGN